MMIGMKGSSGLLLTRRATSMPSILGIMMSSSTRSGSVRSIVLRASAPSLALLVSYPPASRRARSSSTLSSWSSTIRMRAAVASFSGLDRCPIRLSEESVYFRDYRARLAGLGQMPVAAHFHRLLAIRRQRVRGQCDDGNVLRGRVVLENLRGLPAIDDRNGDIHQDEVRLLCPRLGDPFLAVQGLRDGIAEMPQNPWLGGHAGSQARPDHEGHSH